MSLENTNKKTVVISSGSELSLPYNFYCRSVNDIKLRVVDTVGTVTDVVSGFTVLLNPDYDGGSVELSTAYPNGYTITIYRDTIRLQTSEYGQGQRFDSSKTESTFDKVVSMIQEQDERLDRSIKVDIEDTGSSQETTLKKENRKDKVLGFDEDGKIRLDASYQQLVDALDVIDQQFPSAVPYSNPKLPLVGSVREALDTLTDNQYYIDAIEPHPINGITAGYIYARSGSGYTDQNIIDGGASLFDFESIVSGFKLSSRGRYEREDGGGCEFVVTDESLTDNGGTIIEVDSGVFLKSDLKALSIEVFGAIMNDANFTRNHLIINSLFEIINKIQLPVGTLYVNDSVLIPDNCNLTGKGIDISVIKAINWNDESNFIVASTNNTPSNLYISDITIDANFQGNNTNSFGLQGTSTSGNVTIERCKFINSVLGNSAFGGIGCGIGGLNNVVVNNCISTNNEDNGFDINNCDHVSLNNCMSYENEGDNFFAGHNSNNIKIINCTSLNAGRVHFNCFNIIAESQVTKDVTLQNFYGRVCGEHGLGHCIYANNIENFTFDNVSVSGENEQSYVFGYIFQNYAKNITINNCEIKDIERLILIEGSAGGHNIGQLSYENVDIQRIDFDEKDNDFYELQSEFTVNANTGTDLITMKIGRLYEYTITDGLLIIGKFIYSVVSSSVFIVESLGSSLITAFNYQPTAPISVSDGRLYFGSNASGVLRFFYRYGTVFTVDVINNQIATSTSHGLVDNNIIIFPSSSDSSSVTGITEDVIYYVRYVSATKFAIQLETPIGASSLDIPLDSAGSGDLYYLRDTKIKIITNISADTLTINSHGFSNNDVVRLCGVSTAVFPTGLSLVTDYYVIKIDDNTIKLSLIENGNNITILNDGSSVIALYKNPSNISKDIKINKRLIG